jgi:TnpA family transposase
VSPMEKQYRAIPQHYTNLDPILTGTVKTHLVRQAWDETVRVIASIHDRIVSASLILHRLGSYARQNSVHQALAEIGRVQKTIHILRTLDDEEYRRRMGRELNKGEASHDLSRFLCFGKEGALRGREFGDQIHTFIFLSVLHNAVVAWNTLHIGSIVDQLRAEGQVIDDDIFRPHDPVVSEARQPLLESITSILNGCARLRVAQSKVSLSGGFRADVPNTRTFR